MGSDTGPQTKEARYDEMSPVNYLTAYSPALLMIQGDGDTTIPVKQAFRMQEALQTIQAPVEIVIVKNAGHNWRKADGETAIDPSRNEIIELTIQFLGKNR
jgi:dipeptidyl aminopeptidase/acylaminoacyl peptidase